MSFRPAPRRTRRHPLRSRSRCAKRGVGRRQRRGGSAGYRSMARIGDRFRLRRDGYADLAIGAQDWSQLDEGLLSVPGTVTIMYGSRDGLTRRRTQTLASDDVGTEPASEGFGGALASGDFNGDGYADLAIGVDLGTTGLTGEVWVVYGSRSGLTTMGSQNWSQDSPGIEGVDESGDGFGSSTGRRGLRPRRAGGLTWLSAPAGKTAAPGPSPSCTGPPRGSPRPVAGTSRRRRPASPASVPASEAFGDNARGSRPRAHRSRGPGRGGLGRRGGGGRGSRVDRMCCTAQPAG